VGKLKRWIGGMDLERTGNPGEASFSEGPGNAITAESDGRDKDQAAIKETTK